MLLCFFHSLDRLDGGLFRFVAHQLFVKEFRFFGVPIQNLPLGFGADEGAAEKTGTGSWEIRNEEYTIRNAFF